jgi:hypothetical protein
MRQFTAAQLEAIAMDADAEDGIGSVGAVQTSNLNFSQTQTFQATQGTGGSQVPQACQYLHRLVSNLLDGGTVPLPRYTLAAAGSCDSAHLMPGPAKPSGHNIACGMLAIRDIFTISSCTHALNLAAFDYSRIGSAGGIAAIEAEHGGEGSAAAAAG